MANNLHQDAAEDALQRFSQGKDVSSELVFLSSLSRSTSELNGEVSSSALSAGASMGKLERDISMCDIQITVTKSDSDATIPNGNYRSPSPDIYVTDEQGCCEEVELHCGNHSPVLPSGAVNHKLPSFYLSDPINNFIIEKQNHVMPELDQENCAPLFLNGNATGCSEENITSELRNVSLSYFCEDCALVEKFIHYVFTRRYGLADRHCIDSSMPDMHVDPQVMANLNKGLDAVMKRLMDCSVNEGLVSAYSSVLQKASGMPILRKKLVEHVMLWLSRRKTNLDESSYEHVKTFILTGLSDVWSAVRKICSTGVSRIFQDWTQQQQEVLFCNFLEVCINIEGSWQSKDGAALCVHAILSSCFISSSSAEGKAAVKELPTYIVECVLTIVFSLISHAQLSVRETVTKIMSCYMEHVDSQDMLDLMHQTLTLLTPPDAKRAESESFHYVEAYAAEGLLNICSSIFKALPVTKAVHLWLSNYEAFLTYLSHNASSVRQTTSSLFLHVATHRESNAVLMKLVLCHVIEAWHVSLQSLATCQDFLEDADGGDLEWEGKEGRMFVYELLCKHLIEFHRLPTVDRPSSALYRSTGSQDGGSETKESVENKFRHLASHLQNQSSLTQLFLLDHASLLSNDTDIQIGSENDLQDLQRWFLGQYLCLSQGCGERDSACADLTLPGCGDLLMTILHHTAHCLAHPRWELRRIAQQVLPVLYELVCLYDVGLMMSVWRYMTEGAGLLSFMGLYGLHQSLALCARVVATADLSDKESTITNPLYVTFVDGVRKHMGEYLPLVCCHLRREAYDKVSVIAAETALLALNFFDLQKQIKEELCTGFVIFWKNLFIFAHPKSAVATSLGLAPQHQFQSPYEGFRSCCIVRPENNIQCAKQVEKTLMTAVFKHLPHFLPQLDSCSAALCLPLLAHNIGLFIDDTDVCKSLTNSFHALCQFTRKLFSKMASDPPSGNGSADQPLKCVYFTIKELTAIIALKNLDAALLQKILNCYIVVCESLQPETHIPLLLQGVAARMMTDGRGFRMETADDGELDVALCWHRPELPPWFGQHSSVQDEDSLEHTSQAEESESDTSLNRSGSSLGLQMYNRTGRRRTLSTTNDILEIREVAARLSPRVSPDNDDDKSDGDDEEEEEEVEEEESDWDSWSEDESDEEKMTLQTHFQEFFQRLTDVYGACGQKMLQEEVSKMESKERELLEVLIADA